MEFHEQPHESFLESVISTILGKRLTHRQQIMRQVAIAVLLLALAADFYFRLH